MAQSIGSMFATLGLDATSFNRGIARAQSNLKSNSAKMNRNLAKMEQQWKQVSRTVSDFRKSIFSMQTAMAGAAGAAGLGYMINRALEANRQIGKLSKQTGFTTKTIQELKFAAQQTGVRSTQLYDALGELTQRMGEAAVEGGEMAEGFRQAGIQIDGLARRRPRQVFYQLADAIKSADTQAQAAAIAVKTLGEEAGRTLVPMMRQGSTEMKNMADRAHELGLVLDEDVVKQSARAKEKVDLLVDVMGTQWQRAIGELAPEISNLADSMADWVSHNEDFFDQEVPKYIRSIGNAAKYTIGPLVTIGENIGWLLHGPDTQRGQLGSQLEDLRGELDSVMRKQMRFEKIKSGEIAGRLTSTQERAYQRLQEREKELVQQIQSHQRALNNLDQQQDKNTKTTQDNTKTTQDNTKTTQDNTQAKKQNAKVTEEQKEALKEFNDFYKEATLSTTEYELSQLDDRIEYFKNNLDKRGKILEAYKAKYKEIVGWTPDMEGFKQAVKDTQGFMDKALFKGKQGWVELAKVAEDETDETTSAISQRYEHMLDNIQDEFSTQIESMLDGNLRSWDDFFDSILDMFKQTVAEMAALDMTRAIFDSSAGSGAGLFTGPQGGLFGSGSAKSGFSLSSLASTGKSAYNFISDPSGITKSLGLSSGGTGFMSTQIPGTGAPASAIEPGTGQVAEGAGWGGAGKTGGITFGQGLSAAGGLYQMGTSISDFGESGSATLSTISGGLKVAALAYPSLGVVSLGIDALNMLGISDMLGLGGGSAGPEIYGGFTPYKETGLQGDPQEGWMGDKRWQGKRTVFDANNIDNDTANKIQKAIGKYFTDVFDTLSNELNVDIQKMVGEKEKTAEKMKLGEDTKFKDIVEKFTKDFWETYTSDLFRRATKATEKIKQADVDVAEGDTWLDFDLLKEMSKESENLSQTFMRVAGTLKTVPDAMDRISKYMEKGASKKEAFKKLEQDVKVVTNTLNQAIEAGLQNVGKDLKFEDFQEGLVEGLRSQMQISVLQAAKNSFRKDIMQDAFGETFKLSTIFEDYFKGDMGLDELTNKFDNAFDEIKNSMDTNKWNELKNALDKLGIQVGDTAEKTKDASKQIGTMHDYNIQIAKAIGGESRVSTSARVRDWSKTFRDGWDLSSLGKDVQSRLEHILSDGVSESELARVETTFKNLGVQAENLAPIISYLTDTYKEQEQAADRTRESLKNLSSEITNLQSEYASEQKSLAIRLAEARGNTWKARQLQQEQERSQYSTDKLQEAYNTAVDKLNDILDDVKDAPSQQDIDTATNNFRDLYSEQLANLFSMEGYSPADKFDFQTDKWTQSAVDEFLSQIGMSAKEHWNRYGKQKLQDAMPDVAKEKDQLLEAMITPVAKHFRNLSGDDVYQINKSTLDKIDFEQPKQWTEGIAKKFLTAIRESSESIAGWMGDLSDWEKWAKEDDFDFKPVKTAVEDLVNAVDKAEKIDVSSITDAFKDIPEGVDKTQLFNNAMAALPTGMDKTIDSVEDLNNVIETLKNKDPADLTSFLENIWSAEDQAKLDNLQNTLQGKSIFDVLGINDFGGLVENAKNWSLEEFKDKAKDLDISLSKLVSITEKADNKLEEQQQAISKFNQSLTDIIKKNTLSDLQYQIYELNQWYSEQKSQAQDLGIELDKLNKAHKLRLQNIKEEYHTQQVQEARSEYQNAIQEKYNKLQSKQNELEQNLSDAKNTYVSLLKDEVSTIENNLSEAKSAYLDKLKEEQSEVKNTAQEMGNLITSLKEYQTSIISGSESPVGRERQFAFARSEFQSTLQLARQGEQEAMKNLQDVSSSYLESAKSVGRGGNAFAEVQKALNATQAIAKEEKSEAKKQSDRLKQQINQINEFEQKTISQLKNNYLEAKNIADSRLPKLENKLDRFNTNITSLSKAQNKFQNAQMALDNWNRQHDIKWFEQEINRLDQIKNGTLGIQQALSNYQSALTDAISSGYSNLESKFESRLEALREAQSKKDSGTGGWSGVPEKPAEMPSMPSPNGFASGGTISGPESGYTVPTTFHGTEHITTDSQMGEVKEQLKAIKEVLTMMMNTEGEQKKYAKKMWQILDGAQRGNEPISTENV